MSTTRETIKAIIRSHGQRVWSLEPVVTYEQLLHLFQANRKWVEQSGLCRGHAVALDSRLGWRFVGIALAFMACEVTVVPLDFGKSATFLERFPVAIGAESVDSDGRLTGGAPATDKVGEKDSELQDVVVLLHTSGTSGRAKAVMLTWENVVQTATAILYHYPFTKDDRFLISRPLHHASAFTGEMLVSLLLGNAVYIHGGTFVPQFLNRLIERHHVSVLFASPTVLLHLSQATQPERVPSVRHILSSGEKLLPHQAERIASTFTKATLYNVYGLTEAAPRITAPVEWTRFGCECVGPALPSVETRIVGGELYVKSPGIMKGYWKDAEATFQKLKDGWLRTGDRAVQDAEGNLYLEGRQDNMIIRGGVNMFPEEVEAALLGIPEVKDVLVSGVPDPLFGQKIHAQIVRGSEDVTKQTILQCLQTMAVERRLWPDTLDFCTEITRTASGKKERVPVGRQ